METQTPLIDLAPELFSTIEKAQEILAKWIVPDSNISDKQALNELLGVLDSSELVRKMRLVRPIEIQENESQSGWTEKTHYPSSPNIGWTRHYSNNEEEVMELMFKNGNIYQYRKVPKELYEQLIISDNPGKFLADEIKGKFGFVHVNGD